MTERALRVGVAVASAGLLGFLFWLLYGRPEGPAPEAGGAPVLPALNAALNLACVALLLSGYRAIRAGRRREHMRRMIGAVSCSALFLVSYVVHHYTAGDTTFQGQGLVRPVYFTILITHVVATMVAVPMILMTLARAASGRFEQHRAIARWTLPLWLYVSVTGVLIFVFLRIWS